jgi:hypothetical protein
VLVNCFAGCSGADVIAAVGLEWADLMPYEERQKSHRKPRQATTEIQRAIEASLGYMDIATEDRLVLDIARLMRSQGLELSVEDMKRERLAFNRTRRSAA